MELNPKTIKILALDLDDTLLRSDYSVSTRTRNAVKTVAAAGITPALLTGRAHQDMDKYSRLLGLREKQAYLVSNNGALIQESVTGAILYEAQIPQAAALALCDLADAEDFSMQMQEDDIIYMSKHNDYSHCDERLAALRHVLVENFRAMVNEGCYKLIIPGDTEALAHIKTIIHTYLGDAITLISSRPNFLEILPEGTNKGAALSRIAEHLCVGRESVMAIGDSSADIDMLRFAGHSVAMANAEAQIKNAASCVTRFTNDNDGVADFIETFLLGQPPAAKQGASNE